MNTMMISEPVVCLCSECGQPFRQGTGPADADCGGWCAVSVARDIEPYLEPGERLVWHDIAGAGLVLCYFTESTDDDEDES